MINLKFAYPAIRFRQSPSSDWLVSFSASAIEIDRWGGVPEKKNFDNVESTGFQRAFKSERLKSLVSFFSDEKNILQNPLLCAPRNISKGSSYVDFVPDDLSKDSDIVQLGTLHVTSEDFSGITLFDALVKFKEYLESRVPELSSQKIDESLLAIFKEKLGSDGQDDISDDELPLTNDESIEQDFDDARIDESHIYDLWQEVSVRVEVLRVLPNRDEINRIFGFERDSIISYLKPVIVVDGQHRLKGAIEHAKSFIENDDISLSIANDIDRGMSDIEASNKAIERYSRRLPVSMIMSSDPAEHVFQFVVVNQKATPINNALLGTIVSTTLSTSELERVAKRLKDADIPLDASHAVSFATRNPESPFYGFVQTGISGEQSGKLPWSVMKSIVSIFKDLKGAKFYSDADKIDYADLWRRKYLDESEICNSGADSYNDWSKDNGV